MHTSFDHCFQPMPQRRVVLGEDWQGCPSSMDKQCAQVSVAALGYTEQSWFAAGGVLTRNETQPSAQISCFGEAASIAHCRDKRRGVQHSDARDGRQPTHV